MVQLPEHTSHEPHKPLVTIGGRTFNVGDVLTFPNSQPEVNHTSKEAEVLPEYDARAQAALDLLRQSAPQDVDHYGYLSGEISFQTVDRGLTIRTQDQAVELPTALIVRVPDMESWKDFQHKDRGYIRRGIGKVSFHMPWSKPPEQRPVTGLARVYVQPNGVSFIEMINNGAHTVSIARGRRDKTVRFSGEIDFRTIDKNIYPAETAGR